MDSKKNHGGRRPGAGRKSYLRNKSAVRWTISEQTRELVKRYAKELQMSESNLVDSFMFLYLDDCKDILRCPVCDTPVLWTKIHPIDLEGVEVECTICHRPVEITKEMLNNE